MDHGPIEKPRITAVIPVYNEENCLEACVSSLRAQTFSPIEVIAVDDGSSDASVEVCRRLGVKVLEQKHRGPGAARNFGAANASGDILLFVDADMVFDPDYVAKLTAPLVSGKAAASCHWNERVLNWDNPWARCQTWSLGNPDRRRQPASVPDRENVYRAVRKDFFLASGGFAEDEGKGDDSSVSRRTGVFAVIVPDAGCYHKNAETLAEVFQEAAWEGGNVAVLKERRLRRCAGAFLLYRNPLLALLRAIRLGAAKREPHLPVYAVVHSAGLFFGMGRAVLTGFYQK